MSEDIKFLDKLKRDKKFRFEFIIGIWSGIISVILVVALVFITKIFVFDKNTIDSDEMADNTPAVTTEQAVTATETEPPYTSAIVNGNEEDFEDEEDTEDAELKNADKAYATTIVNLRSEPALTASVIGKLQTGDEVQILEYGKEWTKVSYNGTEGYVSTIYLSTRKPAEEPTATTAPKTTPEPTAKPKKTKKPSATKKPKPTKKPVITSKPVVVTPEPTEQPQPTQPPVETIKPTPEPVKPTPTPVDPPETEAPETSSEPVGQSD